MYYIDTFLEHYGWEGAALAALIVVMLAVQLYYYVFAFGRIAKYKDSRRAAHISTPQPISVVIPMFSEDYSFVEDTLPLILAQEYGSFEVVIVYVGRDTDFYDELCRLKQDFPQVAVTKIELNPRFPISPKMALNVGIKSAHNECIVFTTTYAAPQSDRWLSLMAQGFMRGDVVVGYCGFERKKGLANIFMRTWRMMGSALWLSSGIMQRPYRAIRHNFGFTKELYFGANGFTHLNMNIGEDDLFLQKVMHDGNASIIISPRATLREKTWGGMSWWLSNERLYGSSAEFYPHRARNHAEWETGSRMLFFLTSACAIAFMPPEYKLAAVGALAVRYAIVVSEVRRIAKRLGEKGLCKLYFIYDVLSPFVALWLSVLHMHKDDRVWR